MFGEFVQADGLHALIHGLYKLLHGLQLDLEREGFDLAGVHVLRDGVGHEFDAELRRRDVHEPDFVDVCDVAHLSSFLLLRWYLIASRYMMTLTVIIVPKQIQKKVSGPMLLDLRFAALEEIDDLVRQQPDKVAGAER